MPDERLLALDYCNPAEAPVENAARLLEAAVKELRRGAGLVVSFAGLRGASSSYFNVVLQGLVGACGPGGVEQRVRFEFDSDAQRLIFQRSFESVRRLAS